MNWVGIDGYYYSRSTLFPSLFGPTIVKVREITHDPIIIAETGAVSGADQPRQIADHLLAQWCVRRRSLHPRTCYADDPFRLELIVVDDGSTDETSEVGRAHSAIVIRHATNLGLASAPGTQAWQLPQRQLLPFLTMIVSPSLNGQSNSWPATEKELSASAAQFCLEHAMDSLIGYLQRNNPLRPLEANLAQSNRLLYRLKLYLQRQWDRDVELPRREVYSVAGANMSFLRQVLIDIGQFDTRFQFGGEELDLCMRLTHAFPSGRLVFDPGARVAHHFKPSIRDTLRRSRAYGLGSARLYRKWPSVRPTIFPGPFIVLAALLLCVVSPALAAAAVAIHSYSIRREYARLGRIAPSLACSTLIYESRKRRAGISASSRGYGAFVILFLRQRGISLRSSNLRSITVWRDDREGSGDVTTEHSIVSATCHCRTRRTTPRSPHRLACADGSASATQQMLGSSDYVCCCSLFPASSLCGYCGFLAKLCCPFPAYIPCASMIVLFATGLAVDIVGPLLGVRS